MAAEDVIGVPSDEQALAAVGGGDRDIPDSEKERIASQIQDSARANISWRESLPYADQMRLQNVPTVSVPPAESETQEREGIGASV